jgi:histidine triad (HIT) family protein
MVEDCLFCKFAKGEIKPLVVYEDEKYLAFLDINPMHEGHTLLIPKKHIDYIFDMEDDELAEYFLTAKKMSNYLKKATGKEKIGLAVEGFLVRHAHIHLIPIDKGEAIDPCLQKPAKKEDLEAIAGKIKRVVLNE